jgi:hypothetical protein
LKGSETVYSLTVAPALGGVAATGRQQQQQQQQQQHERRHVHAHTLYFDTEGDRDEAAEYLRALSEQVGPA